jgi:hypothetical protein
MAYRFGRKSFWFTGVNMYYAERKLGYSLEEQLKYTLWWAGYTYKYKMADIISREEGISYQLVYACIFRTCTPFRHEDWLCNLLKNNPDVVFVVDETRKIVLKRFPVE